MLAKHIMTTDVITVSPNTTIRNLAMTLIKNQISGAPVSGKNGKIVGVVSEADIVSAIALGKHVALHTPVYDL